ncbi:hypothetical protein [Pseudomonas nicosulfuronedens]
MAISPSLAVQQCEELLRKELQDNQARNILAGAKRVIEMMLSRRTELSDAYEELYTRLGRTPQTLRLLFEVLSRAPGQYSEVQISKERKAQKELRELNQRIAGLAEELAKQIVRKSTLNDTSRFYSETHHHIFDVIYSAAKESKHYEFQQYVQEHTEALQSQFGLKYWQSISSVVDAIGADAINAEVKASDSATVAATESRRSGRSDFVKALIDQMEKVVGLSKHHRISDNTLASLINCALDLDADTLLDGDYIKHLRQRERMKRSDAKERT